MLSLTDIPDCFLKPDHKADFLEWLRILPVPDPDRKAALFLWNKATNQPISSDDVDYILNQDAI